LRKKQFPATSTSMSLSMKQLRASSGVQTIGSPRIETGADQHWAPGMRLERRQQRMEVRVGIPVHGLHAHM
jgi:hypothetical protein